MTEGGDGESKLTHHWLNIFLLMFCCESWICYSFMTPDTCSKTSFQIVDFIVTFYVCMNLYILQPLQGGGRISELNTSFSIKKLYFIQ